jgi:hypothetical protein
MINDKLEHSGILGMKWGVRKGLTGRIKPRTTLNYIDRFEQDWSDDAPEKAYTQVYRKAQFKIRKGTRLLNKNPKYANQNFKKDSPLRQEYYAEYSKMVTDQLNAAVGRRRILSPFGDKIGRSPFGRFELKFEFDMSKEYRPRAFVKRADTRPGKKQESVEKAEIRKFKHSAEIEDDAVEVDFVFDDNGYILDFEIQGSENIAMSDEEFKTLEAQDYIYHSGILGMKWGVRRNRKESSSFKTDDVVKREGQTDNKKVPVSTLTDKELTDRIKRIQLESQYSKMTQSNVERGKQILIDILASSVKTLVAQQLMNGLSQAVSKGIKSTNTSAVKAIVADTLSKPTSAPANPDEASIHPFKFIQPNPPLASAMDIFEMLKEIK